MSYWVITFLVLGHFLKPHPVVLNLLDYCNGTLVSLSSHLIPRLQSVQNAAARLIFRLRRSDHITDALICLHWLWVPERIVFKVAVQTYRALHGDAAQYLRQFTSVADIPTRQRPRSSTSDDLCSCCQTAYSVGRRAFSVAGACVWKWNAHPADVTSTPSLFTFRKRFKLHLFSLSYPGLSTKLTFSPCVVLEVAFCYLGHSKILLIDWLNYSILFYLLHKRKRQQRSISC